MRYNTIYITSNFNNQHHHHREAHDPRPGYHTHLSINARNDPIIRNHAATLRQVQ
jgi:sugar lactone lactonase YvrE